MVVDSSALVAITLQEPDAERFVSALVGIKCVVSSATVLESLMVIVGRIGTKGSEILDATLKTNPMEVIPFDQRQLEVARSAWLTYGKGRHKARLNFGDCIAYALAKTRNEPLLYKGNDFALTDIRSAI